MNLTGKISVVLAFMATGLYAQVGLTTRSVRPPSNSPSHFTFDVVVLDKAGHPVPGLQGSDFTLLDDKKPAAIQSFAAHTSAGEQQSAVVILDALNTGFSGRSLAMQQSEQFLSSQSGPLPFPMALAMLTNQGLVRLGPPSADGKVLLAQLQAQSGQLRGSTRAEGFFGAEDRMNTSLNAMAGLLNYLSALPGRKLLIWISPGWPILDEPNVVLDAQEEHHLFSSAVGFSQEMLDSQVTVCDVDPLGSSDAGSLRTTLWQGFAKPLERWTKAQPGNVALQVLAVQSGGLVLKGSNDLAGELKTCVQDGAAWYTISFTPHASEKPDTWRSVELRLDKPELRIRTREGYYAQPGTSPK